MNVRIQTIAFTFPSSYRMILLAKPEMLFVPFWFLKQSQRAQKTKQYQSNSADPSSAGVLGNTMRFWA